MCIFAGFGVADFKAWKTILTQLNAQGIVVCKHIVIVFPIQTLPYEVIPCSPSLNKKFSPFLAIDKSKISTLDSHQFKKFRNYSQFWENLAYF